MAINTDTGLTPEGLRPQASPVNRFVPPTAGRGLAQLAEGLAQFNPALQRFRAGVSQEDAERGAVAAQQAIDDRMTFNEAIDAGIISRSESPFFRQAFRRQFGRLTADRYTQDLRVAMDEAGLMEDITSMEEFDEFEQQFREQFEEDNFAANRDPDFEAGYSAQRGALMENLRQGVVTTIGNNMEKRAGEGLHQEIHNALRGFSADVSPEQMGEYIQAVMEDALQNRTVTNRRANDAAVEAILAAAESTGRTDILDIAEHIQAGEHSLFDRPGVSSRVEEMRDRIKRRNELEAERIEVERTNTILDGVFEQYLNAGNPYDVNVEGAIRELQAVGGEAARRGVSQMFELRRTLEAGQLETSSLLMGELTARASAGSLTVEELRSRVFRGDIRPDEFAFLQNLMPSPTQAGALPDRPEEQLSHIESHPVYKSIRDQIEASYGPIDMLDEEAGVAMREQLRRIRFDLADWYFDAGGHAYTRDQLQEFEWSYTTEAMERYRPTIESIYRENQGQYGSPRVQGEPTINRWEFEGVGRALTEGDAGTLAEAARMWNIPPDPEAFATLYNEHIQFFGGEPIVLQKQVAPTPARRPSAPTRPTSEPSDGSGWSGNTRR